MGGNHRDLAAKIEVNHREVKMEEFMLELADVTDQSESTYLSDFLKLRLEAVQLALGPSAGQNSLLDQDSLWMEDSIVCLRDQLCINGRGHWKGSVTVGVIIHGASTYAGHGPGVNPIMSTKDGRLEVKFVEKANIADYFGLK